MPARHCDARQLQQRRGEMRQRHRAIDRTSVYPSRNTVASAFRRKGNDQRHLQRRVVGEHPVRELAVVAEPLAVIAGDRHDRVRRLA